MFYALAIGSMLGSMLQNLLLVHHARKIDGLSLAFYRNVGFFFTLLPLLYGASSQDITLVLGHWKLLTVSSVAGGVSLALAYASFQYIVVGVSTTINKAVLTIVMVILGWLLLDQPLAPSALAFIALIILGSVLLGLERNAFPHLDNRHALGLALSILSALSIAFAFYALAVLATVADPLVSSYFWETSIAVACAVLIAIRCAAFGTVPQKISWKTFCIIAACSFPTLIGTGLFSLALRMGPIAIANAIGSGSLAVTALLAWGMYGEKLNLKQWMSIVLILIGVIAMRFV